MIDKLRSMAIFARVAESGSFRRAAERLGLSASVVSHHLTQLEKELGVQLLYRSTRHVALTDPGLRFLEACRSMVESAENALAGLHENEPGGRLWVVAPAPFSVGPFVGDVADFCNRYPRVEMRLEFDDRPRNLIQEGIDVAIWTGPLENSSLICRTLFSSSPVVCATPACLARSGPIKTIDDLQKADWVEIPNQTDTTLYHPDGRQVRFTPRRRASVNSVIALYQLALSGIGVAKLPQMLVDADLAAGRLVQVLPDWKMESMSCYALYPSRAMPNSLARCFVDFVSERMQTMHLPDPDLLGNHLHSLSPTAVQKP